ncbi:MAG: hypothetical protein LBH01_03945 [Verrucomicrobiales bacterium]|jgi:hypothetical protein|nr:hypothetical protein [Verrucomicrobiales bacterium]
MTVPRFLPLLLVVLSLAACSSRALYDTAGAGAGAVIANQLSDGDAMMTAVGAGGGVLASELLQGAAENGRREQYNRGYDRGASDAAKRMYWVTQNLQQPDARRETKLRYYTFPAGGMAADGVNEQPYEVTVPVEE